MAIHRTLKAEALYHSAFTARRAALGVAHPETLEVQVLLLGVADQSQHKARERSKHERNMKKQRRYMGDVQEVLKVSRSFKSFKK